MLYKVFYTFVLIIIFSTKKDRIYNNPNHLCPLIRDLGFDDIFNAGYQPADYFEIKILGYYLYLLCDAIWNYHQPKSQQNPPAGAAGLLHRYV